MAIKLRVISDQYRELGEQRSRVFGVNGCRIGRAPDNDWVLPDAKRIVSAHHCEIDYRGGEYWLSDMSTNGVWVNDAEDPVSVTGPHALRDGDRLRIGNYEVIVSVDPRIDFLPSAGDQDSAARHIDRDIGANLDLDSLLSPRESEDSGSIPVRNAFGLKVQRDEGRRESAVHAAPPPEVIPDPPAARTRVAPNDRAQEQARVSARPAKSGTPAPAPRSRPPVPSQTAAPPDWAMKTRAMTREELADAMARRQSRIEARQSAQPFHRQAAAWSDLDSALQAFGRGAGIDPSTLSPEARSMLPLVAGQLLREAVVGLTDLTLSRSAVAASPAASQPQGSNPLRSSASVDQALSRLFESHGRLFGGPVEALRDVLQEAKDHEAAVQAGMHAGLAAVLDQLAPGNVADQFEQGRARALAAGQDPRPRYWEHYAEFHRVLTQNGASGGLPHPFVEAFRRAYTAKREELSSRARARGEDESPR
jgi:type VI secretion system protein